MSEPNDVPAIVARIKADTKLTREEAADWVKEYSSLPGTQVVGLDFSAGAFTETATEASGDEVGARGRYAVADDKTLVLSGIGTFAVTPLSNGFALKLVKQELPGEVEALIGKVLFESSPFIRKDGETHAIPDGTYSGKVVPVTEVAKMIAGDKKLTAAQRADLSQLTAGHNTMQVQLALHDGALSQALALDGGPFEVGVRSTYAFPDNRTLVTQEQAVNTFKVKWADGMFSLERTDVPVDEADAMFGKILFESTPFSLVP